ncbi:hypothetical protein D3C85_1095590 [compost metagenome]
MRGRQTGHVPVITGYRPGAGVNQSNILAHRLLEVGQVIDATIGKEHVFTKRTGIPRNSRLPHVAGKHLKLRCFILGVELIQVQHTYRVNFNEWNRKVIRNHVQHTAEFRSEVPGI